MKQTTRVILYAVISTAICLIFMAFDIKLHLAILAGLGYFSLCYLIGELIVVKRNYKKADFRAYNKLQGVPAIIGTCLVIMVNVVTSMSFFLLEDITFNVIINLVLIIIVAFLSVFSYKTALIYIKDGKLYADKEIPLTNIIRYTALKNRKGVYKQMSIDYYTDDTKEKSASIFASYSKSLEEILEQNLSKKKRGY